jgi:hypothetical protein
VRKIGPGHLFGFEELVHLFKTRVFTATAGKFPVTCLVVEKRALLSYHDA